MRLALINQFYPPDLSPTAHLAASLVQHRVALGDRVTVLAGTGRYIKAPAAEPAVGRGNPKLFRLWTPSLGKDSLLRRLLDYAAFYVQAAVLVMTLPRQDVLILMTTPPYIALVGLFHKALHARTRLLLWNMDSYPETAERAGLISPGSLPSRILRVLNRILYRHLEAVVCLDSAMRDLLASAYVIHDRPKVYVLPNWEPEALFPHDSSAPEWELGQSLRLYGRFVVLYLGNAGEGHSFETVLDAASRLQDTPVVFLFVGGGTAWESLREEVAARGLTNVILRAYIDKAETPAALACADVALITLRDSMLGVMSPSKLHASLAMGVPILYLGPAGGNVDEAIRTYGCGISLRHGDTQGMVQFIERVRREATYRSSLRSKARHAFEDGYSDRVVLPRFDSIIKDKR